MTLSNANSSPLAVETSWPTIYAASGGSIVGVGHTGPDPQQQTLLIGRMEEVPAHGSANFGVAAKIMSCGSDLDSGSPLPPGDYDVYVTIPSDLHVSSVMAAPPVTITLT